MRLFALLALSFCLQAQVKIAPYYAPGVGTQDVTTNAGTDTSIDMLASGGMARTLMPFTGGIVQFQLYLEDVSHVTAIYLSTNTCATNAGNACLTFTPTYTASFTGPFTANATNTFNLATPLSASKWDALAVRIELSQPHAANLGVLSSQLFPAVSGDGPTTPGESCYTQLNAAKQSTFTLASMTAISNHGCPVLAAYAPPAAFVFTGDSFIPGAPAPSDSVADNFAQHYPVASTFGPGHFWIGNYTPIPIYQSTGRSGETAVQIQARFATDVVALKPAYVFIDGGINDLNACTNTGCTGPQISAIEAALASMMATCQSSSIRCFILLMGPWQGANATNAIMLNEDSVNANTISVAPGYGVTVIDWRCTLGQFRSGGSGGNCWNWQGAYELSDGLAIHPNQAGMQLIGNLIYAALPYIGGNSAASSGSSASGSSGGPF